MAKKKYEKYVLRNPLEANKIPGIDLSSLHLRGTEGWGVPNYSMGLFCITKPIFMVKENHAHDFDQILCFIGGNPMDMKDFGAEVELSLGEECEKYIINTTTVVHVPKGLMHCPLNFVRVDKPILFCDMFFAAGYGRSREAAVK